MNDFYMSNLQTSSSALPDIVMSHGRPSQEVDKTPISPGANPLSPLTRSGSARKLSSQNADVVSSSDRESVGKRDICIADSLGHEFSWSDSSSSCRDIRQGSSRVPPTDCPFSWDNLKADRGTYCSLLPPSGDYDDDEVYRWKEVGNHLRRIADNFHAGSRNDEKSVDWKETSLSILQNSFLWCISASFVGILVYGTVRS